MCLTLHIRVLHFCGILKKKSIYTKCLCLLSRNKFFPGLPNFRAQIRCAQNWYTAVQMDLKYRLPTQNFVLLLSRESLVPHVIVSWLSKIKKLHILCQQWGRWLSMRRKSKDYFCDVLQGTQNECTRFICQLFKSFILAPAIFLFFLKW